MVRWLVRTGVLGLLLGAALSLHAQVRQPLSTNVEAGEKIYKSACIACHGPEGKGMPRSISGFKKPDSFPDFTRCGQTTAEANSDWKAMIVYGGQFRGFSQIMPSFGQALSFAQIDEVIAYLRAFCHNSHWPRGELNVPRALVTEKAYPEDEAVISTAINAQGMPGNTTHLIQEQRFGVKNQIEVDLPLTFEDQNHTWYGGVGDVTLGLKRAMYSNLRTGSIFALQGSVIAPTGSQAHGFGTGTTTFETFAAFDQYFPGNVFVQTQFGADLPHDTKVAPQTLFFNSALGESFAPNHGLGRLWSPMVEFVANRDLVDFAKTDWDVVPQMQVTISRRQHIRGDLGVRVPFTNTFGRPIQVMFYLLWDWQDGKLTEGW